MAKLNRLSRRNSRIPELYTLCKKYDYTEGDEAVAKDYRK